jgi:hypothetical protein
VPEILWNVSGIKDKGNNEKMDKTARRGGSQFIAVVQCVMEMKYKLQDSWDL